jgi:hypothetical protein
MIHWLLVADRIFNNRALWFLSGISYPIEKLPENPLEKIRWRARRVAF